MSKNTQNECNHQLFNYLNFVSSNNPQPPNSPSNSLLKFVLYTTFLYLCFWISNILVEYLGISWFIIVLSIIGGVVFTYLSMQRYEVPNILFAVTNPSITDKAGHYAYLNNSTKSNLSIPREKISKILSLDSTRKYTQQQIADQCGVTWQYVGKVLKRNKNNRPHTISMCKQA